MKHVFMNRIKFFISRAQEPTLENNNYVSSIVVDLWQDLPNRLKILTLLLFLIKKKFLLKTQFSKKNYGNDCLYLRLFLS